MSERKFRVRLERLLCETKVVTVAAEHQLAVDVRTLYQEDNGEGWIPDQRGTNEGTHKILGEVGASVSKRNRFVHISRAFYAESALKSPENLIDEVEIIFREFDCEFFVKWHLLGSMACAVKWHLLGGMACARLEIFDDAWILFKKVPELFELLFEYGTSDHTKTSLTPEVLCGALLEMGFLDRTPTFQGQWDDED